MLGDSFADIGAAVIPRNDDGVWCFLPSLPQSHLSFVVATLK